MHVPKNDPSRTYIGVLPLLIEFFATQPVGSEFSFEKLAEQTGFTYRQVRTSLRHAHESGRLNVSPVADGLGVAWMGLGPNAKLADRDRLARVPQPEPQVVGVATEAVPAGGTGEVRLLSVTPATPDGGTYGGPTKEMATFALCYTARGGGLVLEDESGELWKAVRI